MNGVTMILGYPWRVNSHTQAGAAANNVSAYFGDLFSGLTIARRMEFQLEEFMETRPGFITHYGEGRAGYVTQDLNGVSYLQTRA